MRCDLHVHTRHSGMCSIPLIRRFCRESYNPPDAVYHRLKALGMDLVTVTDHDSIDAAEPLRRHPDFFLSEEVTCRTPCGTELHIGVYDISERQHIEIQRRRDDLPALAAYLQQQQLFFSANHIFSALTGRRTHADFQLLGALFPAIEGLNGHVLAENNWQATRLAMCWAKALVGGSDAHTLPSLGSVYTEVSGTRHKAEFLEGLRLGMGRVRGASGSYWKLTREALLISREMVRERFALSLLLPLALGIPAVTLASHLREVVFAHLWRRALEGSGAFRPPLSLPAGPAAGEAPI